MYVKCVAGKGEWSAAISTQDATGPLGGAEIMHYPSVTVVIGGGTKIQLSPEPGSLESTVAVWLISSEKNETPKSKSQKQKSAILQNTTDKS